MTPRDANASSGGSRKPQPSREGWRKGATRPASASGTHSASGSRAWWSARRSQPAEQVSFRTKIVLSLFALLGLVVALAVILSWTHQQVPLIALGVTDYKSELLPPNAWTQEDLVRFKDIGDDIINGGGWLAPKSRSEISYHAPADEGKNSEAFIKTLEQLLDKEVTPGRNPDTAIVYISAHGVVDENGTPCLLLSDSDPHDAASWITVRKILDTVRACKQTRTKLVVFDSGRMESSAACGQLNQDFAARLRDVVEGLPKEVDDLVVINSTSDGEVAWAAPELAGSVFGYYFGEALAGQADADRDRGVSLQELANYLQRSVDGYVSRHRNSRQRPTVLLPPAIGDPAVAMAKEVVHCTRRDLTEAEQKSETARIKQAVDIWSSEASWKTLNDLWTEHDRRKYPDPPRDGDASQPPKLYQLEPAQWARFERKLIRAEQTLMAGAAYEAARKEAVTAAEDYINRHPVWSSQPITAHSLPLAALLAGREPRMTPAGSEDKADPANAKVRPPREKAAEDWRALVENSALKPADLVAFAKNNQLVGAAVQDIEVHFAQLLGQNIEPTAALSDLLKLALGGRNLAEIAAAPPDQRTTAWILANVEQADLLRREAEDLLFVGPASEKARKQWHDYDSAKWKAADTIYRAATERSQAVAKAFDLRDLATVEIPYLAAWAWQLQVADERPQGGEPEAEPKKESAGRKVEVVNLQRLQSVNQLCADWHELAASLDADPTSDSAAYDTVEKRSAVVKSELEALEAEFQSVESESAGTQSRLAEIERHLAYPLLTAERRQKVCREFLTLLRDKVPAPRSDEDSSQDAAPAAAELVSNVEANEKVPLPEHPFIAWLSSALPTAPAERKKLEEADFRDRCEMQGGMLRKRLSDVQTSLNGSLDQFKKLLTDENLERAKEGLAASKIHEMRAPLSGGDLLVRSVAAWFDAWPPAEADTLDQVAVVDKLHKFDLHQLLVWQARRTLNDFWGGDVQGKSYFEVVAGDYLDWADRRLLPEAKCLRAFDVELLGIRRRGLEQTPAINSQTVMLSTTPGELVPLPLKIEATAGTKGSDLPPGVAAAYLREQSARESLLLTPRSDDSTGNTEKPLPGRRVGVPLAAQKESSRAGIALQAAGSAAVYDFRPPADAKGKPLDALVWYRGHTRSSAIRIDPPGVQIVFTPEPIEPGAVRVSSNERVRTSVMFVFDCSYSMHEKDFVDDRGALITRMEGARRTLINILGHDSLRQLGGGVGLRLYGHRFNYSDKNVLVASAYAKAQEAALREKGQTFAKLHPGEDVELVYSVDVYDRNRRRDIEATLRVLEPHGATPLYRAIADSLKDAPYKDQARRIIVLTDGLNEQQDLSFEKQTTAASLRKAFPADSNVTVDVIGFGKEFFGATTAKQRDALRDLEDVCTQFRGKFYTAQTTKDLLDRLTDSLDPGKFDVHDDTPGSTSTPLKFGQTWSETKARRLSKGEARIPYQVGVIGIEGLPTMDIQLQGSERVELTLERRSRDFILAYPEYFYSRGKLDTDLAARDAQLNALGRIVSAPRDKFWVSSAIAPHWEVDKKSRTFIVQIQNYNLARFTPRPADAWIEITPVASDGKADTLHTFRFCDLKYAPNQPVPQIVCEALQFPEGAKQARVQVWFSMAPLPSDDITTAPVSRLSGAGSLAVDGVKLRAVVEPRAGGKNGSIVIHEQRTDADTGKPKSTVKIDIESSSGSRPVRIVHDYTLGTHRYEFDESVDVEKCVVEAISVDKFKKLSLQCELPLEDLGKR